MSTRKLACCSCGGALEVPEDLLRTTCKYCGSLLEVKESAGAWFTQLEQLERRTTTLERKVRSLEVRHRTRNALRYLSRRRRSAPEEELTPSAQRDLGVGLLVLGAVILLAMIGSGEMPAPGLLFLGGVIALAGGWNVHVGGRAMRNEEAAEKWRRRRRRTRDAASPR